MPDYLRALPDDLETAHVAARRTYGQYMSHARWRPAYEAYRQLYGHMLARQAPDTRFHKGEALANMALAKLAGGDAEDALKLMAMAFIEDALSKADEREVELNELHMPAAHNLVYVFAVPGPYVANASVWVRNLQGGGRCLNDAAEVIDANPFMDLRNAALAVGKPLPGRFIEPWGRRVFVGGSYDAAHFERLTKIRDAVNGVGGFIGVLVSDYAVPEGMNTRDHALMMLHECGVVILDLSFTGGGGQLIELERVFDYAAPTSSVLLVYDSSAHRPQAGSMSQSQWTSHGVSPVPYADFDELQTLVTDFLVKVRQPPPSPV